MHVKVLYLVVFFFAYILKSSPEVIMVKSGQVIVICSVPEEQDKIYSYN